MTRLLTVFLVGAVISTTAQAEVLPVVGGGHAPCSALIEHEAFYVNHANMQWLLGYLSGAAMAAEAMNQQYDMKSKLPGNLMKPSAELPIEDVQKRCVKNPSKDLHEIGTELMILLGK